jgi:hypothetical protein
MSAASLNAAGTFSSRGSIDFSRVEQELAALWRQAGERASDQGQAVTRACLWNLVECQPLAEGKQAAPSDAVDEVGTIVPSRLIRLRARPVGEAPQSGREVEAWVSARCNPSSGGGHQIRTEEIRIAGYGEASLSHFPALVRALLVPDLPVALIWLAEPPRKGRLLRDLLRLSDRILIDSQPGGDPGVLPRVNDLVQDTQATFVDLGWMRLTPMRYLLASLFDPPGRADQLHRIERLRIDTTPNGRNTGLLMLGWLLTRLGRVEVKAEDSGGMEASYTWKARLMARQFPIEFHVREGAGGLDGLLALEIAAGGDRFAMRQVDEEHIALDGPDHAGQKLALHGWSDPELLVAGLGAPGIDALYPQALAKAANLIEAEDWNR